MIFDPYRHLQADSELAVAGAEVILLSWLFLAVAVPKMFWTRHVESTTAKEITQIIG